MALQTPLQTPFQTPFQSVGQAWIPSPLPQSNRAFAETPAIRPPPTTKLGRIGLTLKLCWLFFSKEFLRWLFPRLHKPRPRSAQAAEKLRECAESLGGIWVSLARLVSLRSDLLGVEFCLELARTIDRGIPLPFVTICKSIDDDLRTLGTSFEKTFASFEENPLAVRSFGQFHRARLRQRNREVVVRVRAPGALQRAALDGRYMQLLFLLIEKLGILSHLRWDDLLFEVKKYTDNLLDFRIQLAQLDKLRKSLRKERIYVPRTVKRLCTERLLITEYIAGPSIAELAEADAALPTECAAWKQANEVDCRKLFTQLFNAHQLLLFEHNLFFTDLSPRTIIVLRKNRIAFVGYNVIGTLSADHHRRYQQLYRALLGGDYSKVSDLFLILGPPIPHKDLTDLRMSVIRMMRRWASRTYVRKAPYQEKSMAAMLGSLARCISEDGLPTFWSLARLHLAESNLDQSLAFLDSTRNCISAMRRYRREAEKRSVQATKRRKSRKRFTGPGSVRELGMQLLENFEHDGDYLRHRLVGYRETTGLRVHALRRLFSLFVKGILAVLFIEIYFFLKQTDRAPSPSTGQSATSHLFAFFHLDNKMHWTILLPALLVSWLLIRLIRSLFVRPREVVE